MAKNEVRIIGGKWGGRKLKFPDAKGLRPSQDRGRETLFNWLTPWIADAHVLDLFAGSGVLGFEALSRGAKSAELVDNAKPVIAALNASKALLQADTARVHQADAQAYLRSGHQRYDLVFLDPPYASDLLPDVLAHLATSGQLSDDALIYTELPRRAELTLSPKHWQIYRDKTFGEGRALLLQLAPTG